MSTRLTILLCTVTVIGLAVLTGCNGVIPTTGPFFSSPGGLAIAVLVAIMIAVQVVGIVQERKLIQGLRTEFSFVDAAIREREAKDAEIARLRKSLQRADETVEQLSLTLGDTTRARVRGMASRTTAIDTDTLIETGRTDGAK